MRTTITMIVALLIGITGLQAQTTINDVKLPASFKPADAPQLFYNGGGIRKKLFFKVYVAGLYLTGKSQNAEAIVNADEAMAVKLTVTSSVVSSDNMSEAIQEGFEMSLDGNTDALQSKIDQFISTFQKSPINEGDLFDIVYIPGTGVQISKNGILQVTVSGLDFKKALFGIWLSDDPISDDLKEGMLGL